MTKESMIIHKRFQIDYSEGSIEVQVNFVVDNGIVEVSNIQIHGTFDTDLPNFPFFEQISDKAFLVSHHINTNGKTLMTRIIGNKYANNIIEQIVKLKNEIINSH